MSQPDSKNHGMKWMWIAMVVCCAVPIAASLLLGGGLGVWLGRGSQQPTRNQLTSQSTPEQKPQQTAINAFLEPAVNWRADNHVHGLTVNPDNPQVMYVATHNGLLKRSETGEWFWMEPEKERADYMGFTAHPTDSNRFYASGHPHTGGNLGFQITENQDNWALVPNTQNAPVVGLALLKAGDNTVMYGYRLLKSSPSVYRSADGGKTWKQLGTGIKGTILYIAIAPSNPQILYAVNNNNAVFQSQDSGATWKELN
ncbi:WD40/YVTN/BNR-like repeat-containing protein [Aerosakkonema funiforme]|uniref:WD40/YVTN/BNR-like repeat-containing protein n=1 Tax=Aerosakkonema funiforme TaxID=1246630 RepID=UPI0035BB1714